MKVAYLFDTFPTPSETFLAREISALRQQGLDLEIWALRAGKGAHPIPLPQRILRMLPSYFWRLVGQRLAPELRATGVTHIHAAWANHVAEIGMAAAHASGLPWSFAAHARDLWVEGGNMAAKLASARFATACTRAGEARLREFGANVLYMAHGVEIANYQWHEWNEHGSMRLCGVGRLVAKKGWADAMSAVEMLNEQGRLRAHLTIVGDGPLYASLLRESPAVDAITLRGALPHEEAIAAMQAANCFVLPSRVAGDGDRDGLANVLLEAAALGLPLVTTDAGSARDLVDEETGWLCEPENAKSLTATIERVWYDPAETRRRCRNARQTVEQQFDAMKNVGPLFHAFNVGHV